MFGGELKRFGITEDSPLHSKLPVYLKELADWNRRMNLTGPDRGDFLQRHVYDCLAGLPLIRDQQPGLIADVGTGAGLPGLLLAMTMPEVQFLLVEKSPKKCLFLKHVVSTCQLDNVRVFNGRIADVGEKVDLVVFRAVSPLEPLFLMDLSALCHKETRVAAYKGRREKIDQELRDAGDLITGVEIHSLSIPGLEEERHLVLFRLRQ